MKPSSEAIAAHLPLASASFHILLALAEEDRHGYAVLLDVERRTGGEVRLSVATLYRTLERLLEAGLIEELADRPAPELDDERRRYYRLTPLGAAVARAETDRLAKLVRLARAAGLAARTSS